MDPFYQQGNFYPNQMNYPPMSSYPYPQNNMFMPPMQKRGIIPMNMQSTLRTAQKAIVTFNQIIPVIYQVRPILYNAKTAFRVIKAVKQMDLEPEYDQQFDKEIDEALNLESNSSNQFENML